MGSKHQPLAPLMGALGDLLAWFNVEGVRAVVIGGVAASLLGRPRATRDVDVLVLLEEEQWEHFLASAAPFGFAPRLADPIGFARQSRV